jgi:hypothetical protein
VKGWTRHWQQAGDECVRSADRALEADGFGDACQGYLAAAEHYWLALSAETSSLPERRALEDAHESAFRSALPLLPSPTVAIALQVADVSVSGYLFMPAGGVSLSPAVIWPVDATATVASSYRQVVVPILESGAACAVFSADAAPSSADQLVDAVASWVSGQPGVQHVIDTRATLRSDRAG